MEIDHVSDVVMQGQDSDFDNLVVAITAAVTFSVIYFFNG